MPCRRPPLVRQASRPLTKAVKAKLLEAKQRYLDSIDDTEEEIDSGDLQALDSVDASELGVHLRVESRGDCYFYTVSRVVHSAMWGYVSEGDMLLVVRQTHVTHLSPEEIRKLCKAGPTGRASHVVFATRTAFEEETVEEVEYITLKVCFKDLDVCVEAEVLGCRRWQRKVRALRTNSPSPYVATVNSRHLQVVRGNQLAVVDAPGSSLQLMCHKGHCTLEESGVKFVTTLGLPLGEGTLLFLTASRSCQEGEIPLTLQNYDGSPFETEGGRQVIKKDGRCMIFTQSQKNGGFVLTPIDFPDMCICVDRDGVLIGKEAKSNPDCIAYFDFLPVDSERDHKPRLDPGNNFGPGLADSAGLIGGKDDEETTKQPFADSGLGDEIFPPECMGDVTPIKPENDVNPQTPNANSDDFTGKSCSDVNPQKPSSGVTPAKTDDDAIPERHNDVTPQQPSNNVTPERTDDDVIPDKHNDVTPQKPGSDVTPKRTENDVTPRMPARPDRRPSRQDAVDVDSDSDSDSDSHSETEKLKSEGDVPFDSDKSDESDSDAEATEENTCKRCFGKRWRCSVM